MGELADRLDRVIVQETSPDGGITATQAHRNQITLQFRPGAYRRYDEPTLAGQLAELARAVRTSCRRSFYETVSEVTGRSITAGEAERELDGRDRRFRDAQRALHVGVRSPGGWIIGETQGLDHWRVRIRNGALRTLSEREFVAEATAGLGSLLGAYRDRDRQLRDEFFDLKLPGGGRNGRQR
jgi:hypothetical protein